MDLPSGRRSRKNCSLLKASCEHLCANGENPKVVQELLRHASLKVTIIDRRKANSRFHRALHVSYPNDSDRERAQKLGTDPGGDIMIHGIENGLGWIGRLDRVVDWTDGCMAVTDPEIEEIWAAIPDGTPVEIRH